MRYTFAVVLCIFTPLFANAQERNEPPGIRGYLEEAARIQEPGVQLHDREHQYGNNQDFGNLTKNAPHIPVETYADPEIVVEAMSVRDIALFLPNLVKFGYEALGPVLGMGVVSGLQEGTEAANTDCSDVNGCLTMSSETLERADSNVSSQFSEPKTVYEPLSNQSHITGQALNDARWSTHTLSSGGLTAVVCPLNDEVTGNVFCVNMFCEGSNPLQIGFAYVGGDLPDLVETTFIVDGKLLDRIPLPKTNRRGYPEHAVTYDADRHASLVQALRTGRSAEIILQGKDFDVRHLFSLAGSSRSIGDVLNTCPIGGGEAPNASHEEMRSTMISILSKIADMCNVSVNEIESREGVVQEFDLNSDGMSDFIVDSSSADCMFVCGASNCQVAVLVSTPTGFRRNDFLGYSVTPQSFECLRNGACEFAQ